MAPVKRDVKLSLRETEGTANISTKKGGVKMSDPMRSRRGVGMQLSLGEIP